MVNQILLNSILNTDKLIEYLRKEIILCGSLYKEYQIGKYNKYILNYSDKASKFEYSDWDEELRTCRGLIIDSQEDIKKMINDYKKDPSNLNKSYLKNALENSIIIERPIKKFFNLSEIPSDEFNKIHKSKCLAFKKYDGELGIMYYNPIDDELSVATRGSFHSIGAMLGTEMLRKLENYEDIKDSYINCDYLDYCNYTILFEIIHPKVRKIVDYNNEEKLIYIGRVNKETGDYEPPYSYYQEDKDSYMNSSFVGLHGGKSFMTGWLGYSTNCITKEGCWLTHEYISEEQAKNLWCESPKEAIESARKYMSVNNNEGIVITLEDGSMYKIKFEEYLKKVSAMKQITKFTFYYIVSRAKGNKRLIDIIIREEYPDDIRRILEENCYKIMEYYNKFVSELNDFYKNTCEECRNNNTNVSHEEFKRLMVEKIKDPEHDPKMNGIMFDRLNNTREDLIDKKLLAIIMKDCDISYSTESL